MDPNAYEVSRMYWALPLERRQYRTVAKSLYPGESKEKIKLRENLIGKLVRQWDQEGKVLHMVLEDAAPVPYLPLVPELEDPLRRRYGLRDVCVVKVDSLSEPADSRTAKAEDWYRHNDMIHRHLGVWAGRIATTLIRPGDVVGTAGGRAMYFTAMSATVET